MSNNFCWNGFKFRSIAVAKNVISNRCTFITKFMEDRAGLKCAFTMFVAASRDRAFIFFGTQIADSGSAQRRNYFASFFFYHCFFTHFKHLASKIFEVDSGGEKFFVKLPATRRVLALAAFRSRCLFFGWQPHIHIQELFERRKRRWCRRCCCRFGVSAFLFGSLPSLDRFQLSFGPHFGQL
jgi:hypothetical protein